MHQKQNKDLQWLELRGSTFKRRRERKVMLPHKTKLPDLSNSSETQEVEDLWRQPGLLVPRTGFHNLSVTAPGVANCDFVCCISLWKRNAAQSCESDSSSVWGPLQLSWRRRVQGLPWNALRLVRTLGTYRIRQGDGTYENTVDGSEIPNNHRGCMKPCK